MAKFQVNVKHIEYGLSLEIEADSEYQADEIAIEMFHNGEIDTVNCDFQNEIIKIK